MNSSTTFLVNLFEGMEQLDLSTTPGTRFMKAMFTKLKAKVDSGKLSISYDAIEDIICNMVIELGNVGGEADDDEFIDRTSTSMANMIVKLYRGFADMGFTNPEKAIITAARQLSIKVG